MIITYIYKKKSYTPKINVNTSTIRRQKEDKKMKKKERKSHYVSANILHVICLPHTTMSSFVTLVSWHLLVCLPSFLPVYLFVSAYPSFPRDIKLWI